MSFARGLGDFLHKVDPSARPFSDTLTRALEPKSPPPSPGLPNPNDAANASQALTDQMRQRRGLLSNLYAGTNQTPPLSGKTTLGT